MAQFAPHSAPGEEVKEIVYRNARYALAADPFDPLGERRVLTVELSNGAFTGSVATRNPKLYSVALVQPSGWALYQAGPFHSTSDGSRNDSQTGYKIVLPMDVSGEALSKRFIFTRHDWTADSITPRTFAGDVLADSLAIARDPDGTVHSLFIRNKSALGEAGESHSLRHIGFTPYDRLKPLQLEGDSGSTQRLTSPIFIDRTQELMDDPAEFDTVMGRGMVALYVKTPDEAPVDDSIW